MTRLHRVRALPRSLRVNDDRTWDDERTALLGRKISELGLTASGSRIERLTQQAYAQGHLQPSDFDDVARKAVKRLSGVNA